MSELGTSPSQAPVIAAAVGHMAGYASWWAIAGGWAVDLAIGSTTRAHDDVEVCVLRRDLDRIRSLVDGWDASFVVNHPNGIDDAGTREDWAGEDLELPVHQIVAIRGTDRLDLLLNESAGDVWRYRRDVSIEWPLAEAARRRDGIPYLAPGIVLLYKSKRRRPKDEADFALLAPALPTRDRRFLADSLRHIDPTHEWLDAL